MKSSGRARRIRRRLMLRYPGCIWCGKPWTPKRPPTFEHLLPKAFGGTDHQSNLVLACKNCNLERGHWYQKHAGHLLPELERIWAAEDAHALACIDRHIRRAIDTARPLLEAR